MAKPIRKNVQKEAKKERSPVVQFFEPFFTEMNRIIFGAGIIIVIIGFYALAQLPVDGSMTMSVAPFLLVIGFLVIIPVAIMYRGKQKDKETCCDHDLPSHMNPIPSK